jgi:hypothetical protein
VSTENRPLDVVTGKLEYTLSIVKDVINDVVIENMMNPADGGTASPFIVAMLSRRTIKKVLRT